jgi:hypothetical protein
VHGRQEHVRCTQYYRSDQSLPCWVR